MVSDDLFDNVKAESLPQLVYQGVTIHERDEMLCLTDMWRADGSRSNRRPAQWRQLPASQDLIAKLAESMGKSHSNIFATSEGRYGATWAHWQIAIAYAQYLSPEFHLWCNKVVRFHMEGGMPLPEATPIDTESRIAVLEAQVSRLANVDFRKEVAVPIMSYLHNTLQKGYLDARFYKIAERQFEDHAIIETMVDDITKLRQAANAMMELLQGRSPTRPDTYLSISEAMSRLQIRTDRPRGLAKTMSGHLQAWCETNKIGVQRRAISDGVVRYFFSEGAVDRWWAQSGAKAFGRYVKKGVRA